jgi:hypothetical protein
VGSDATQTLTSLDLEVKPNSLAHLLDPGTYQLDLRLAASNCQPVPVTVELSVTGRWYADEGEMLAKGIDLKVL